VNSYVPVIVGEAIENLGYLEAKRSKMGHLLPQIIAEMEQ